MDMTMGLSEHDELAGHSRAVVAGFEEAGIQPAIYDVKEEAPLEAHNRISSIVFRTILTQFDEIRLRRDDSFSATVEHTANHFSRKTTK